jgi:hypothetical protein
VKDVASTVNKLHKATVKLSQKNSSWDNEKLRTFLRQNNQDFEDMAARTHPHLFTMVVDKHLSSKNFKRIQDLIAIRYMHEQNPDVETNTKIISSYFHSEFYNPVKK